MSSSVGTMSMRIAGWPRTSKLPSVLVHDHKRRTAGQGSAETTRGKAMKRIEFSIRNEAGAELREPGFLEDCDELPLGVMRAVEDYLDANEG